MFKSIRIGTSRTATCVAGVVSDELSLPRGLRSCTTAEKNALREALQTPGFKADLGDTAIARAGHLIIGLGRKQDLTAETLRIAGARLVKRLDRIQPRAVRLLVHPAVPRKIASPERVGHCLAEGMALANWRVDFFDGKAAKTPAPHASLSVTIDEANVKTGYRRGLILAECANEARRFAATPPNICNPAWMTTQARRLARKVGLTCRVISYAQARQQGMGGIVNVGRASATKPCLIILEHKPPRARADAKLALIGKTITYDTGGYSLKVSNGMKGMKYDKCGGMAVLGAMHAIARLKLPVNVVGLLPAAENMVNGEAYRPDDIITMYNGVSVEVTNTDAEGRLVLADALAYACKRLKPTAIVDAATLTGGVVVGLGHFCAGAWCTDDDLMNHLDQAAEASGEKIWRLPLWNEHKDFMRAKHADIWNSAPSRNAHPIQGAAFLSYFVDRHIPWAHLDIAGVASVDSDKDLYVQGPTGYGVRLLTELAAAHARPARQ